MPTARKKKLCAFLFLKQTILLFETQTSWYVLIFGRLDIFFLIFLFTLI